MASMPPPPGGNPPDGQTSGQTARVEHVLAEEVARIDSPEKAEEVARRVEQLVGIASTGQAGRHAAAEPGSAATDIEAAASTGTPPTQIAATLTETAAQIVAPTHDASAVATAAAEALPPTPLPAASATRRGRRLLRNAMLRRMGPLQRLDVRLFLAVNTLPHPVWTNALADTIAIATTGGWIWLLGLLLGRWMGLHDTRRALRVAAPSILGTTWAVEQPIKALFRRRRPFIDVVRALVVGRRPDGWSFPSGHSAGAFAGAWVLSTWWPRRAPIFFALAASVGVSRVYVGAHYPGDVVSGAMFGMVISEAIRRATLQIVS
ncbi:MAG: phosphatase PAP2 family protein [Chloroflexi bacterium]|nr:phosphatase PAP2 family protein [Chloroflexota bacterium]